MPYLDKNKHETAALSENVVSAYYFKNHHKSEEPWLVPKPKPEPVSVLSTFRAVQPKNLADSTSTVLSGKKSTVEFRKNNA